MRRYQARSLTDPSRAAERDALLAYLAGQTAGVVASGDYEALVDHVHSAVDLYSPDELEATGLPAPLEPALRALLEAGRSRGDEGRTLAALVLLAKLHPDDADLRAEHDRILAWAEDSRRSLDSELERAEGMLEVYVAATEVDPSTSMLDAAATRFEARRDSVFAGGGPRAGRALQALMIETPLEVAALYLEHQDVENALRRVQQMGHAGSADQVVRALQAAGGSGPDSVGALWEFAEAYASRRPEVVRGVCLRGRRDHPGEPRFPVCLARVAAGSQRYAEATAYFAEAIDDAPSEQGLYDEALAALGEFISNGLFDADPSGARALATNAEHILEERARRFPNAQADVPMEQFQFLFGMLEMNSGEPAEAERRFQASVGARPTPMALTQWGILLERTDRPAEAARKYREALDLTPQDDLGGLVRRAEILAHMGDAYRASGEADQANRMYRQSIDLFEQVRPQVEDERRGFLDAQRGILLDRLGRHDAAREAFMEAMTGAPSEREVYATILSYLVVAAPDLDLALEVYEQVRRQMSLDPEWKVYFGLWVGLVAARARIEAPAEVATAVRPLADADAWYGKLAAFAVGQLSYEELARAATTVGERCEAAFYEGARRFAAGDRAGAKARFEEALGTHMVSFFEYAMAQELVKTLP